MSHRQKFVYFAFFASKVKRKTKFTLVDIKTLYDDAHLDLPTNPHDIFSKLKPKIFIPSDNGCKLHRNEISELKGKIYGTPSEVQTTSHLEKLINKIQDKSEKSYLEEILKCYRVVAPRACVVLTWILCINRLQDYILAHNGLSNFNQALIKSHCNAKRITNKDDFEDLKEYMFLDACKDANIITKAIWKILKEKLDFRNSCAHPSNIVIPESKVTSFIEDVLHNVLFKYTL